MTASDFVDRRRRPSSSSSSAPDASRLLGVPNRPPIVATVDVERLFNSLDFRAGEVARIEQLAADYDGQLADIDPDRGLQGGAGNFEQGGEAWMELSQKAEVAISEYQAIEQFARLKIEAERPRRSRPSTS